MRRKSVANKLPYDFDALPENGWESNINDTLRKMSHSSGHALKSHAKMHSRYVSIIFPPSYLNTTDRDCINANESRRPLH